MLVYSLFLNLISQWTVAKASRGTGHQASPKQKQILGGVVVVF
jgi:hypothetical protein